MKNILKVELWLHGLFGGFIGGGASALSAWLGLAGAHSLGMDVPQLNWKGMGVIFVTSGITNAMAYLKKSPLPPMESDGNDTKI